MVERTSVELAARLGVRQYLVRLGDLLRTVTVVGTGRQ